MTYRILTKKSNVADLQPHPSELLPGELALNYSDMILYALDSDGNVQQVSSSGGGGGDLIAMDYTFWVQVVPEDATAEQKQRFEGTDDAGRSYDVNLQGFDVALNGVSLVPNTDYQIDEFALILTEPAEPGDVVIIRSLKAADGVAASTLTTNDIALLGEDTTQPTPQGYKDWLARNNLQTQQDANWHLKHAIENIDVPDAINLPENIATTDDITAAVEGLATEEWVTEQIDEVEIPSIEGLTTQEYVDGADKAVQRFATAADDGVKQWVGKQNYLVDEGQNAQIETLENKVDALEGTVVEAKFKADSRDAPTIGGFCLQDDNGFKQMYFSTTTKLEFWKSDFTNKVIDFSKVMNGDIIRLVMSPDNYANYTVTGIEIKEQTVQMSVTFGSHGKDQIAFEGTVYDFTHTTPFDVGSAATKQYVDAQDGVTLEAAKAYADSLDIPEAISTDGLLSDSGEQQVETGWKVRAPGSSESIWTYLSLANAGEMALNHLREPTESHHAVNKGWVTSQHYVSTDEDKPLVNKTITWNQNSGSTTPKLLFSNFDEYNPQNHEKNCFYGNYKSGGGQLHHWSFGFNEQGGYWNYDWRMGSNLTMRWIMGDQSANVMSVSKTGVDMTSAYIVGDYALDGVAEDQVEAVKAKAREIDIGHRLRELKKILVNLKTALKTKSADAQQALLDVLENVEDI